VADTTLVVDYTSKDYAAFRDDMLSHASTLLPQWTSRSTNDFGVVLVELFAYMGDILSFYGDRIANEAFLETATQRSSVLAIARMLDYRPNGTAAAKTNLTFTTAPGSGAITIPRGTRVSTQTIGAEPLFFETDVALTIPGTTGGNVFTGTVAATEGTTIYETIGTSSGAPGQEFLLTQSPVIEASLDVYMDEGSGSITVWTWVDHLIEWGANDRVFTTYADENNVVHVLFGDGVNGKIPAALTVIQAGYRVGGGEVGNVGPATLTTMDTPVTGVINVTNSQAAVGGQDAETLDQIRANAPKALIALNRAVTLSDYESLAQKVPGIAKAKALSAVYSSVTLYVAPLGGGLDTQDQPIYASATVKQALRNYLTPRIPAPTTVTLADPTYVKIDISFDLVVAPQYNQKSTEAAVKAAVLGTLAYDDVEFGQRVTIGETFAAINSVIGVGYATITKLARSGGTGAADVQLASNEIPVPGTLTVTTTGGIVL
jgi:uncharacterized phage protein gp47/JayE